jgi:hypothetical protein
MGSFEIFVSVKLTHLCIKKLNFGFHLSKYSCTVNLSACLDNHRNIVSVAFFGQACHSVELEQFWVNVCSECLSWTVREAQFTPKYNELFGLKETDNSLRIGIWVNAAYPEDV